MKQPLLDPASNDTQQPRESWFGEIPAHWADVPLRRVADLRTGHTPSRNVPEYWEDCDIPWVTLSDVGSLRDESLRTIYTTKECISKLGLENSAAELLPAKTVILSRTASVGFAAILGVPMATTQDFVNWICGDRLRPDFLLYVFRAMKPEFRRLTNGSVHQTIYMPDVSAFRIPLPPANEQDKIVHFLDRETAEADALVSKYEQLIELLEEKRVALVTRAVTKGLDPGIAMKDSGIEWIGCVPEHWRVLPVRRFAKNVETGGTPPEDDFSSAGLPWYTPGDFRGEIDLIDSDKHVVRNAASIRSFPKGSVLVVGIGATLGKVGLARSESSSNQQCNAIIPYDDINPRFLAYTLIACYDEMRSHASASTLPILNQSKMKGLELPIAPRSEQERIAKWIDSRVAEIGVLTEKAKCAIALVRERRSALITAAVTGQIDVSKYRSKQQPAEVAM